MRKIQFTMAAKFLFLAVILVCGFLATSANASSEGPGQALLFTYYDVRSALNGGLDTPDNYFTVINTSSAWVQSHVRVRTGDKSVELLDFDIMMSPNDVFTFTISREPNGIAFSSLDIETIANTKQLAPFIQDLTGNGDFGIEFSTDPNSPFFTVNQAGTPVLTSLITRCEGEDDAEASAHAQKGYVEVIEEGMIMDCATKPWNKGNQFHNVQINGGAAHVSVPSDTLHGLCPGTNNHALQGNAHPSCSDTENLVDITEHTLYELASNHADGTGADNNHIFSNSFYQGLCEASIEQARPVLVGRVYFASISGSTVTRLTHMNAESVNTQLGALRPTTGHRIILHQEFYNEPDHPELSEVFTQRCLNGQPNGGGADNADENCFAYVDPQSNGGNELNTSVGGADDMNFCFYQDREKLCSNDLSTVCNSNLDCTGGGTCAVVNGTSLGVRNKFGAAATFGPTLSDLFFRRDGTLDRTSGILSFEMTAFSVGQQVFKFISFPSILKQFVISHFVSSPALGMDTAFAFVFPFHHFVNETITLGGQDVWNLAEVKCTTQTGGFISPGLPGPKLPSTEEAFLQTISLTPACASITGGEGWTKFGPVQASNDTQKPGNCTFPGQTSGQLENGDECLTQAENAPSLAPYTPGWTGGVFLKGGSSLTSSLLNVDGARDIVIP